MLQQGARALTSLYAELSQQLKHSVLSPVSNSLWPAFKNHSTSPPSFPRIYLFDCGVFLHCGKLGQCRERERQRERGSLQNKRKFYKQVPTSCIHLRLEGAAQLFQALRLQTLKASVCICMWFGTGRFLIKVNAKYPEM